MRVIWYMCDLIRVIGVIHFQLLISVRMGSMSPFADTIVVYGFRLCSLCQLALCSACRSHIDVHTCDTAGYLNFYPIVSPQFNFRT